jgi:hypothetical protein
MINKQTKRTKEKETHTLIDVIEVLLLFFVSKNTPLSKKYVQNFHNEQFKLILVENIYLSDIHLKCGKFKRKVSITSNRI